MWAVGLVKPNTEMKILRKLNELGVVAFTPLGRKITKPMRKKKPVVSTFKIFPGYVFVEIPVGFNYMLLFDLKINFLKFKDAEGHSHIACLMPNVVEGLMSRDETKDLYADLFADYGKKELRSFYTKGQLVCWKEKGNYVLGFVAKSTQGKGFAYISAAEEKQLKISVDRLSLLQL